MAGMAFEHAGKVYPGGTRAVTDLDLEVAADAGRDRVECLTHRDRALVIAVTHIGQGEPRWLGRAPGHAPPDPR